MASLHKHVIVEAKAEDIWSAVRDVGALHTRLVPGFVTDTRVEGDERVVTFGSGQVARESIVSSDDARKRLCWAIVGGFATHYNAVMHVIDEGGKTRVTWDSDFLPHALSGTLSQMQDLALATLKKTAERGAK